MRMTIGSRSWPLQEYSQFVSIEEAIHRYSRYWVSFRFLRLRATGRLSISPCCKGAPG